jgi:hypothetical protein
MIEGTQITYLSKVRQLPAIVIINVFGLSGVCALPFFSSCSSYHRCSKPQKGLA